MERKTVAQNLTDVIAEEIEAQVSVLRPVDQMAPLIADAILDFFEVRTREGIEFSPRGNISEQEVTGHHEQLTHDLAASIRLGYEAVAADPNVGFEMPPHGEIAWLAAWLVTEGWTRDPDWPHQG
jgi:hypothetical protein